MELKKGHRVMWTSEGNTKVVYTIKDIVRGQRGGEILYEWLSSMNGTICTTWHHKYENIMKWIEDGTVIIVEEDFKPLKQIKKLELI